MPALGLQPSLRDGGTGFFGPRSPSSKLLGYFHASPRDENQEQSSGCIPNCTYSTISVAVVALGSAIQRVRVQETG